ncbi:class I SAM-dependent methyltransferase [Streptomyces sp. G5(2025)]|uniref:class I SAM-dependent methyltransferase n=1 Tax=Streptomyces sp. G5(2025) TaxID=3406628 RepID=UPI003C29A494
MSLEHMHQALVEGAKADELASSATSAEEFFYAAMVAHRCGDVLSAAELSARAAALEPRHGVYQEVERHLRSGKPAADVYAEPEAFTAFAQGGGNVGLYQATHQALRSQYAAHRPGRLLDIGSGEGHGLLPSLTADVGHVDSIEPSAQRLGLVTAELSRRGVPHRGHPVTVQEFTATCSTEHWDLVQETFALLAVDRQERRELLRWLRPRTDRLAFAEFDVPALGEGLAPQWFRYLTSRYDRGIREYDGADRSVVAQGFLIPVLLGMLGSQEHQRHHEQPISRWVEDLRDAGFAPLPPQYLFDYWWAPAFLLVAE